LNFEFILAAAALDEARRRLQATSGGRILSLEFADAPDAAALAEEQRRLDSLRRLVDVTCALLRQAPMAAEEAYELAALARREALSLFPDKAGVFDLVIAPRLGRILDERWPARWA
jgi:hypothetical protein